MTCIIRNERGEGNMGEKIQPACMMEINAGNDANGNSRRAALVFGFDPEYPSVAILCDAIEENYNYPEWVRQLPYLGQFPVPVRRYKAYLKRAAVAS